MPAAGTDAQITAEIRFWWQGGVPEDLRDRFGEAAGGDERRIDTYALAGPYLGVKQRGDGGPVELKMLLRGGIPLPAPNSASAPAQLWAKRPAKGLALPDSRRVVVEKQRRLRFWRVAGRDVVTTDQDGSNCQGELGTILIERARWGTFCLEATGPFDRAPAMLAAVWEELALPQSVHSGEALSYPALLDRLF